MPRLHGQSPVITRILGWARALGGGTPPAFSAGEEGDVNNTTVEITFSMDVFSTLYDAGVTIKINGVSTVISSATRQANHALLYFVVADAIDINDVVTFEYDDDFGDYEAEVGGVDMLDVSAQGTTNYVGSNFYFDSEWSSGHFAHL